MKNVHLLSADLTSSHAKPSLVRRIAFPTLVIGALAILTACGSGGLAHTVPDDAMSRVTGEDQVKLQASAQGVAQAEQNLSQVEAQVGSAADNISAAEGEVKDAERELDALEDQRREIQEKITRANAKVEWRREQRVLAQLQAKAAASQILVAKAKHELEKFRVVGRVETGSEDKFQARTWISNNSSPRLKKRRLSFAKKSRQKSATSPAWAADFSAGLGIGSDASPRLRPRCYARSQHLSWGNLSELHRRKCTAGKTTGALARGVGRVARTAGSSPR